MAVRCNIHRGSGDSYRRTSDVLGINDTDVNRARYPERNFPCDEHHDRDNVGGATLDCVCKERERGTGVGGVGTGYDRCRDYNVADISDRRRGCDIKNSCFCRIIRCLCGNNRRREGCRRNRCR